MEFIGGGVRGQRGKGGRRKKKGRREGGRGEQVGKLAHMYRAQ